MDGPFREMPDLELALLRRGVDDLVAELERCQHCHRTPLVGERVYLYAGGTLLCELCRRRESEPPRQAAIVHGPAFGQSLRIVGQRAA